MTTTTRHLVDRARIATIVATICPITAYAVDLPFERGGSPANVQRYAASRPYMAMQWPITPQPHRFDVYGNPLGGFFVTVPDPLVVNNGCAKAIEPTYDVDGNLAGYAPLVACR